MYSRTIVYAFDIAVTIKRKEKALVLFYNIFTAAKILGTWSILVVSSLSTIIVCCKISHYSSWFLQSWLHFHLLNIFVESILLYYLPWSEECDNKSKPVDSPHSHFAASETCSLLKNRQHRFHFITTDSVWIDF